MGIRERQQRQSTGTSRLGALRGRRTALRPAMALAICVLVGSTFATPAAPAVASVGPTPAWRITAEAVPSNVPQSGHGLFMLWVDNVGDAQSVAGSPVTVVDQLPPGVIATLAGTIATETLIPELSGRWGECTITSEGHTVTCTYQAGAVIAPVASEAGKFAGAVNPAAAPAIGIEVNVEPLASGILIDTATVSGGGAPGHASDTAAIDVSSSSAPFGLRSFHQWSTNVDGTPATQAGSHSYETTTSFALDTEHQGSSAGGVLRDLRVELPAGFVGNPTAVPTCSHLDFDRLRTTDTAEANPDCPADTQVGVAVVYINPSLYGDIPVYNLVPPVGVPAQFGIAYEKLAAFIDAGVGLGPDGAYRVVVDSRDVQTEGLVGASVTFWGDPADPSHDDLRFTPGKDEIQPGSHLPSDVAPRPFLSLPTSCGLPQTLSASAVNWEDPSATPVPFAGAASTDEQNRPVILGGCSRLDFSPSLELAPETSTTDTPTGLDVNLRVPQNEDPNRLAEADLKSAVVTLPPGLTLSPSAANGLEACSPAQIGIGTEQQPSCPAASKVGYLEVTTPLLEHPLVGEIYLAQQETVEGSLVGVYLVVDDPRTGVLVKLPGRVELGGQQGVTGLQPGQVRTVFDNSPQLPFSDLKLKLFGGPRAALVTPQTCGTGAATTQITGWNGAVAAPASNGLTTSSGCSQGFSPAFAAGTTSNQAGTYSPLSVSLSRSDSEQQFSGLSITLPPGLLAKLAGVPLCGPALASEGECPQASRLGSVTVAAGPGPEPVYVTGSIFLTGAYNGGPFGEVVEVPAIAGPFDLDEDGRPVVVRGSIRVNPSTGQATVVSDPLPTELKGIQLDERSVNVTLDRPAFTLNPTSCGELSATGAVTSTQGTVANVSGDFKATGCSKLPFKPVLTIATQPKTSKAYGASLTVKISQKPGEANIHRVDLQIPKALPARLTTLQQACTEAQFNENPARCPAGSVIGTARAITPLLESPLSGPMILVSHGGAAFPDVELVLQGQGVTIVVDGKTDIKKGITYSRFETVPDAPISSFEAKLPEGPDSIFSAYIDHSISPDLCGQKLLVPTTLAGQNGAELKETTKIAVTGCPKKAKQSTRAASHTAGRRRRAATNRRAS
jgi:hypothetical protein